MRNGPLEADRSRSSDVRRENPGSAFDRVLASSLRIVRVTRCADVARRRGRWIRPSLRRARCSKAGGFPIEHDLKSRMSHVSRPENAAICRATHLGDFVVFPAEQK